MRTKALIAPLVALVALVAAVACRSAGEEVRPAAAPDPWHDLVWVHVSTGTWFRGVAEREIVFPGGQMDRAVPADYDGDGRVENVAVRGGRWTRSDGTVLADLPSPGGVTATGGPVAEPVPADYDGDGRAEPAWFRPSDATWWIGDAAPVAFGSGPTRPAIQTGGTVGVDPCGQDHDLPVPADYDGDGRADLATYSPRTGRWSVRASGTGQVTADVLRAPSSDLVQFPVPADYDGVGRAQRALFDANGWLIEGHAKAEPLDPRPAGVPDVVLPVVGDVDGDGRVDRGYGEISPTGATWRFIGRTETAALPGTPGPGVPRELNPLLLTNIGRFTVVARGLAIACPGPPAPAPPGR